MTPLHIGRSTLCSFTEPKISSPQSTGSVFEKRFLKRFLDFQFDDLTFHVVYDGLGQGAHKKHTKLARLTARARGLDAAIGIAGTSNGMTGAQQAD